MWKDPITEIPELGATETWEFFNLTVDGHPIHIHLVGYEIINRQLFDPVSLAPIGQPIPPLANELGRKDTVLAYPGEVTRVKATFDLPGLYVWHCHIVEHEDNEMMRSFFVEGGPDPSPVPISPDAF
jgi:FtsP/CotA-like multicopper oxidase with cupredoxin domain